MLLFMSKDANVDVVICGGGLAGLTLALQLRNLNLEGGPPSVCVIERTTRPLKTACHKVGESSVEVSTNYFSEVLCLKDYLDENHVHKNGLRFFTGPGSLPLEARTEIGPSEFPKVPSFQLDRGRFEEDLRAMILKAGAELIEGDRVASIELGKGAEPSVVTLRDGKSISGRWVVDAAGRAKLLGKKLGLKEASENRASASWFRVKGDLKVGQLVGSEHRRWHARDIDQNRWQSTIHLMGEGYWVWIIPLSTGYTSIGIVADTEHHDFREYHRAEGAMAWIEKHEPRLFEALTDYEREDFHTMPNYSYLASRVFDGRDRWACVGEAGVFVDPLYSLGGDFLSMSNCYTARLIAEDMAILREQDGALTTPELTALGDELNETFLFLARDAARTLSNNGQVFRYGDVFGAKLWWDFYNYWSNMGAHFFQRIYLEDTETLTRFRELGKSYYELNSRAQRILEGWARSKTRRKSSGARRDFIPLPMFPSVLAKQHLALEAELTSDETFDKMRADLETGKALVGEVLVHAVRDLSGDGELLRAFLSALEPDDLKLLSDDRVAVDALERKERRNALSEIGRDMERALGRHGSIDPAALELPGA